MHSIPSASSTAQAKCASRVWKFQNYCFENQNCVQAISILVKTGNIVASLRCGLWPKNQSCCVSGKKWPWFLRESLTSVSTGPGEAGTPRLVPQPLPCATPHTGMELGWQETADSSGKVKTRFPLLSERQMTHVKSTGPGRLHNVSELLFSEESGNTDAKTCGELAFQASLKTSAHKIPASTVPSATARTETVPALNTLNSSSDKVLQLQN